MYETASFNGFPEECVRFLLELRHNNNREWFNEHKSEYETFVKKPTQEFAGEMAIILDELSPVEGSAPQFNFSIFRIYRDIRFSKNKTPYKTHIGVWFWEGKGPKMENSGYYFHLEPPNLMLGTGIHTFSKTLLKAYRDSVVDPEYGPELEKAIEEITQQEQYSLGGQHYKRVPRGYDPEDERAGLLLYNGLYAGVETEIPTELFSDKIFDYCLEKYRYMIPIHYWLYDMTGRAATS
ncbi:DUF2461 domain-containing protein [Chloroflexota bacterium]